MTGKTGRKHFLRHVAAILPAFLLLSSAGCFGSRRAELAAPEPAVAKPSGDAAGAPAVVEIPPAVPIVDEPAPVPTAAGPPAPPAVDPAAVPSPGSGEPQKPAASAIPREKPRTETPAPAPGARPDPGSAGKQPGSAPAQEVPAAAASQPSATDAARGANAPPRQPPDAPVRTERASVPPWSTQKESLAFRVDFLGITMGYARFIYRGKVSIGGKPAYHVNVRAWTSGILSYIYPINETIDYYLDMGTIEPMRIEYTGRKNKRDDVAVYDQEKGKIVYRYRDDGQVRKVVDVVPAIHDPVSAVYYFRWKDMGQPDRPKNVYGGRKVYQIAAVLGGPEKLRTNGGEVDTLIVRPVIRRDGKLDKKGDLRMWVTNDERRVPVRFYGKFRKIREWTLVGELMPERAGG